MVSARKCFIFITCSVVAAGVKQIRNLRSRRGASRGSVLIQGHEDFVRKVALHAIRKNGDDDGIGLGCFRIGKSDTQIEA